MVCFSYSSNNNVTKQQLFTRLLRCLESRSHDKRYFLVSGVTQLAGSRYKIAFLCHRRLY